MGFVVSLSYNELRISSNNSSGDNQELSPLTQYIKVCMNHNDGQGTVKKLTTFSTFHSSILVTLKKVTNQGKDCQVSSPRTGFEYESGELPSAGSCWNGVSRQSC